MNVQGKLIVGLLLIALCSLGCTKNYGKNIAHFNRIAKNTNIDYSIDDERSFEAFTIISGNREILYNAKNVINISRNGNNLLIVLDSKESKFPFPGFDCHLIIGDKGKVIDLGEINNPCLLKDHVIWIKDDQIRSKQWPTISVYNIANNTVEYSLSISDYAKKYLPSDFREMTSLIISPSSAEGKATLSFMPEDKTLLDLELNIENKGIDVVFWYKW